MKCKLCGKRISRQLERDESELCGKCVWKKSLELFWAGEPKRERVQLKLEELEQ